MKTDFRTVVSALFGLVLSGLLLVLLFVLAGTINYWQAWVFIGVLAASHTISIIYWALTNPAALQRRVSSGPIAETRTAQKIIIMGLWLSVFASVVFSALDHRFGWSQVPAAVCVVGDVLVAIGIAITLLVVIQNNYAAATVRVEEGQTVVASGVYRFVRHPMYVGNVIMLAGIPLALGSYWGLLLIIPGTLVLVYRILDEEKLLTQELAGYREYTQEVRYRLVPYMW
jgi:protein-S-isoprenylcysteine O-methyltransferase Ste14